MNERNINIKELQNKLGITFKETYLLEAALTHSSFAKQTKGTKYSERLEFLGDSVLSLIITEYIFTKYNTKKEGELTKLRALIVCEESLYNVAIKLNLGKYILMSKGEELTGGRDRVSILADSVEATIGAIYIDQGLTTVRDFVLNNLSEAIHKSATDFTKYDYKTKLQELVQKNKNRDIKYELVKYEGPPHSRMFYVSVHINNVKFGEGVGNSKKEAEKNAAKEALDRYENGK